MKAVFALLMISVAFLGGSSLHSITIAEPAPEIVTEFILLPANTITYGPQEAAVQVYTPDLVAESTPESQVPRPRCHDHDHEPQAVVEPEESKRYYNATDMIELLAHTPWPVQLWPAVLRLVECESLTPEGADSKAVGDEGLMPMTGPSLGLTQINISEWPQYKRSYNLLNAREGLLAAWSIYVESGYSFSPWSCAP